MSYASLMTICNPFDNLFKNSFSIPLFKPSIRFALQVSMKGSTSYMFHYENNILSGIDNLKQLNYIFMLHFLHQLNLPFYTFPSIGLFQFIFFINFESNLFICWFVETNTDNSIGSLADLFANNVII